jgi:uncharacterized protein YjiS (DUF1127 family)
MTFLNDTSNFSATPAAFRKVFGYFARRVGRLINNWIAARIAHREYQANLALLRSLGDRELRDMGLDRCQIGDGLAEAAKVRSRWQQSRHPDFT